MHDFRAYIRLGMVVFMVSKVKKRIWKGFLIMEQDLVSFGVVVGE